MKEDYQDPTIPDGDLSAEQAQKRKMLESGLKADHPWEPGPYGTRRRCGSERTSPVREHHPPL